MPRGPVVASPVPGAVPQNPGDVIQSSVWNATVSDIYNMFNTAQPIEYGGSNASTPIGAFDNFHTSSGAIPSAATTDLSTASGYYVEITGTTTITGFGTEAAGVLRALRFSSVLTLTHNATSLILPGAANITTASGDTALFVSEGGGNWRALNYQRAIPGVWTTFQDTALANSAPLTITGFPSDAKIVEIDFDDIAPITNAQNLRLRTSPTSGPPFDSGASDYNYAQIRGTVGASVAETGNAATTEIVLTSSLGSSAGQSASGTIRFRNPGTVKRQILSYSSYGIDNTGIQFSITGGGRRNAATVIQAMQLFFASGNLSQGRVVGRYFR